MQPNEACKKNGVRCEFFFKYPNRCALCSNQVYYSPEKIRVQKNYTGKKSNRQGPLFEAKNHEANQKLLTASNLTPNSGAGKLKGDEQITGLVRIMEELKTRIKPKISRGTEVFTIHKDWFKKLESDSLKENMEFWYVKFRFAETEPDTYVAINQEIMMDIIASLVEDRRQAKLAQLEVKIANARADKMHAENILLEAKLREMQLEEEYNEARRNNSGAGEGSKPR